MGCIKTGAPKLASLGILGLCTNQVLLNRLYLYINFFKNRPLLLSGQISDALSWGNLIIPYYLSASEIWPDKRSGRFLKKLIYRYNLLSNTWYVQRPKMPREANLGAPVLIHPICPKKIQISNCQIPEYT
jgi:hypothetical protein